MKTKLMECVEKVYKNMPVEFDGIEFLEKVRETSGRFYVYDGTILRYLRFLKDRGIIGYVVLNKKKSKYKKIESVNNGFENE